MTSEGKAFLLEVFVPSRESIVIEVEVVQQPMTETGPLGPIATILRMEVECDPKPARELAIGRTWLPRFLASPAVADFYFRLNRKNAKGVENALVFNQCSRECDICKLKGASERKFASLPLTSTDLKKFLAHSYSDGWLSV